MDSPLVSILVLNYNGKKYLKECFDSLLKGTYTAVEILLIDNNSSDDSVQFTRENYKQVKIVQTHANNGYSRAYNIAFKHASGKYYVLLPPVPLHFPTASIASPRSVQLKLCKIQ